MNELRHIDWKAEPIKLTHKCTCKLGGIAFKHFLMGGKRSLWAILALILIREAPHHHHQLIILSSSSSFDDHCERRRSAPRETMKSASENPSIQRGSNSQSCVWYHIARMRPLTFFPGWHTHEGGIWEAFFCHVSPLSWSYFSIVLNNKKIFFSFSSSSFFWKRGN